MKRTVFSVSAPHMIDSACNYIERGCYYRIRCLTDLGVREIEFRVLLLESLESLCNRRAGEKK